MVGSRGFEPRSARSKRAASAHCATSRWWPCGPSGWTRTTTTRVKSPACCVDTTEGISTGANGGIRTRTSRLGRPAGEPLPHIRSGSAYGYRTRPSALATRDAPCTPRPNVDRCRSPAHRLLSLLKDPARCEHSYRPCWRQRQDSNPDPRDLEARMLPLHHAAGATDLTTVSKTNPPRDLARVLSRAVRPKQKGLLGDRPRRPVSR